MASSPPPAGKPKGATPRPANKPNLRERFDAMRNLVPFLRQIWQTSRVLTTASLGLRVVRALMPVATLYIGKLIIDEVVRLTGITPPGPGARRSGQGASSPMPPLPGKPQCDSALLGVPQPAPAPETATEHAPLTLREPCLCCGAPMRIIEIFRRGQTPRSRAPPREQAA